MGGEDHNNPSKLATQTQQDKSFAQELSNYAGKKVYAFISGSEARVDQNNVPQYDGKLVRGGGQKGSPNSIHSQEQ